MQSFKIKGEFIQLNQLLKVLNWVDSGAEANDAIEQQLVTVNGTIETRKRNKLVPGMIINFLEHSVKLN